MFTSDNGKIVGQKKGNGKIGIRRGELKEHGMDIPGLKSGGAKETSGKEMREKMELCVTEWVGQKVAERPKKMAGITKRWDTIKLQIQFYFLKNEITKRRRRRNVLLVCVRAVTQASSPQASWPLVRAKGYSVAL